MSKHGEADLTNLLKQGLKQAEKLKQEISSLQAKKQQLQSSVATLEDRLESGLASIDASFEARKNELHAEIGKLRETRDVITDEVGAAKQQKEQLEAEIADLTARIVRTTQELNALNSKLQRLEASVASLTTQRDNITTVINAQINEVATHDTEKQERSQELAQLNERITAAKQELDDLRADYETRKRNLQTELNGILHKTKDAVIRLQELEAQDVEARKEIANQRTELAKERQVLDRMRGKLERDHGKLLRHQEFTKL